MRRVHLLLLGLLAVSCASTVPYASDYPLSAELFRTREGGLTGRVPRGWSSQARDTLAPALAAWLLRDDAAASLAFRELKLDAVSARAVEDEGPAFLARLSAGMLPGGAGGAERRVFEIGGRKFCAYETGEGGSRRRIVVFGSAGKFYECEARAVKGRWSADDFAKLFSAQQSMLATLSF